MATVRATWPAHDDVAAALAEPRDDLVAERRAPDGSYEAVEGPFTSYRRTVEPDGEGHLVETTHYRVAIPWFGWLFHFPVRAALRRPPVRRQGPQPWWAPPERLDARAALVLGLLAAASIVAAFVNTLFTQTVAFAADEFGASDGAQGVAGAVVRGGIIVAVGFVLLADRRGRRQMLVLAAFAAPLLSATGALAPSFAVLTATQALGRPIGIALLLLIGIVAAEEMPAGARAYGVSVLTMAAGLGAGVCVAALPLADLGEQAWRLIYVVPVAFVVIAVDLARRLPETRRFVAPHGPSPKLGRRRFALLAWSAFLTNLLVAPASFFQNRYLKNVRGFSATKVAIFTLCTNTPAGIGIVAGGRLADIKGRRLVGAVGSALGAIGIAASFATGGAPMWLVAAAGSIVGGAAVPALGVYGAELFPTGNRGRASGFISVISLVGSSAGLLAAGWLLDRTVGYGVVMAGLAIGPLIVSVLVVALYPETAHAELEDLNPEDRRLAPGSSPSEAPAGGPREGAPSEREAPAS